MNPFRRMKDNGEHNSKHEFHAPVIRKNVNQISFSIGKDTCLSDMYLNLICTFYVNDTVIIQFLLESYRLRSFVSSKQVVRSDNC
mgnify:CR=1 FL=1